MCLLPYLSPQRASEVFDQPCDDYEQALKLQLSHCSQFFGKDSIKIPVCHVFARGGMVSESELFLGESGQIHPDIFNNFSVPGHLHRAHFALKDKAYYPNTILLFLF